MTRSLRLTGRSRWLVPAAAAALVVGGPAVASLSADRVDLPPRTAEQLLVDLQRVDVAAYSGAVATSVDLGLPALPGVGGEASPGALLDGDNVVRVWRDGERARTAILAERGEYVVVRDGRTVWTYSSADDAATRLQLPEPSAVKDGGDSRDSSGSGAADGGLPLTPDLLAQSVLLTLDQSSDVTVDGSAVVAGRPAYELVVTPRSAQTLIGSVRLAVDAETSMPLRVQVLPRGSEDAAISVGWTDLDMGAPDAALFDFTPPPGAEVERVDGADLELPMLPGADAAEDGPSGDVPVERVGAGFDTVVLGQLPDQALQALSGLSTDAAADAGDGSDTSEGGSRDAAAAARVLDSLPEVSGGWGSGRLVRGSLFSVVLADDGRVAVGAVTPQALYAALAR